ncbi:hypothetical protein AB0173_20520 [Klebsiella quasipneumoniae]|uniref:hypothetical protein n=1 Tax=Klebsiella quasipneumoniae TaxID=1463165 RepID=UPI00344C26D3
MKSSNRAQQKKQKQLYAPQRTPKETLHDLATLFFEKKHMKQYEMDSKSNVSHTIHDYCIEPRKTSPYIFAPGD